MMALIVIDSEIGAGKTTLISLLATAFKAQGLWVAVIPEPVSEWERVRLLQEFSADQPPKHRAQSTYIFQTYAFVTRVKSTQKVVAASPDADIYLLEHSVLTDCFVFMELLRELVGPRYMEMYEAWWEMWSQVMPIRPEKFVYLNPSLNKFQARVEARALERARPRRP